MHKSLQSFEKQSNLCYKTLNLFATWRYIYFFSDAPHLLKTARNCLHHSGFGEKLLRCLWKDGSYLLWEHIAKMWREDAHNQLKLLPKITYNHIHLTPYSKMTVSFAAQVPSQTISKSLECYGSPDTVQTSKFCNMIDIFFDCLNIRHPNEWKRKRKENLKPFTSVVDNRFEWLEEKFLGYLKEWENSIKTGPGNFTKNDRARMFISWQTYLGFQITCHSTIELVKFLLSEGMQYVLTEGFCEF